MKIDGRIIAQKILENLKKSISQSRLHPTLAVILVGENPASISYIRQKQKAADYIGAKIIVKQFNNETMRQCDNETMTKKLIETIGEANIDPPIHGIIVQLPLPSVALREGGPDPDEIINHITPNKDVDGFTPNSPFTPPVAMAILKILEEINSLRSFASSKPKHLGRWQADPPAGGEAMTPPRWTELKFLVIGRGLTAGKPIANTLRKLGYKVSVAHSKTRDLRLMTKNADVIISCVGKSNIVKAEMLKPDTIVIGVGIHRTADGKLAGDFNEDEIAKVASFFTPTPGGVGPVNVAYLMENLVKAASKA